MGTDEKGYKGKTAMCVKHIEAYIAQEIVLKKGSMAYADILEKIDNDGYFFKDQYKAGREIIRVMRKFNRL